MWQNEQVVQDSVRMRAVAGFRASEGSEWAAVGRTEARRMSWGKPRSVLLLANLVPLTTCPVPWQEQEEFVRMQIHLVPE